MERYFLNYHNKKTFKAVFPGTIYANLELMHML